MEEPYSREGANGNIFTGLLTRMATPSTFCYVKTAAWRYFEKSIARIGVTETVIIGKAGANLAALETTNDDSETPMKIRQSKHLNNLFEQDRRAITR